MLLQMRSILVTRHNALGPAFGEMCMFAPYLSYALAFNHAYWILVMQVILLKMD